MNIDSSEYASILHPEFSKKIFDNFPFPLVIFDSSGNPIYKNFLFTKLIENRPDIEELYKHLFSEKLIELDGINHEISNTNIGNKHHLVLLKKSGDDVIKSAAHDLNNIFTGIANSIELLHHKAEGNEDFISTLKTLENSTNRAIELFDEVLNKNKSEKAEKKRIYIDALIEDVGLNIREISKGAVEVDIIKEGKLQPIMGRYSEVFRVFLNLCVNAKDAMQGSGKILISAEMLNPGDKNNILNSGEHTCLLMKVRDYGTGIPQNIIDKIFDKGFSTKEGKRLSGLGLNIVKDIVEDHGGIIIVESKINKGTEFFLYFPVIEKKVQVIKNITPKVLIAEDEEIIREELAELFNYENFEVIVASDGLEVMEIINSNLDINLIIIDKKMPGVDGLTCIEKIRDLDSEVPIILATGSIPDAENRKIKGLRIDKIIKKPYSIDDLLDTARQLVL